MCSQEREREGASIRDTEHKYGHEECWMIVIALFVVVVALLAIMLLCDMNVLELYLSKYGHFNADPQKHLLEFVCIVVCLFCVQANSDALISRIRFCICLCSSFDAGFFLSLSFCIKSCDSFLRLQCNSLLL